MARAPNTWPWFSEEERVLFFLSFFVLTFCFVFCLVGEAAFPSSRRAPGSSMLRAGRTSDGAAPLAASAPSSSPSDAHGELPNFPHPRSHPRRLPALLSLCFARLAIRCSPGACFCAEKRRGGAWLWSEIAHTSAVLWEEVIVQGSGNCLENQAGPNDGALEKFGSAS